MSTKKTKSLLTESERSRLKTLSGIKTPSGYRSTLREKFSEQDEDEVNPTGDDDDFDSTSVDSLDSELPPVNDPGVDELDPVSPDPALGGTELSNGGVSSNPTVEKLIGFLRTALTQAVESGDISLEDTPTDTVAPVDMGKQSSTPSPETDTSVSSEPPKPEGDLPSGDDKDQLDEEEHYKQLENQLVEHLLKRVKAKTALTKPVSKKK